MKDGLERGGICQGIDLPINSVWESKKAGALCKTDEDCIDTTIDIGNGETYTRGRCTGVIFDLTYNDKLDYPAYIGQCKPASCTYYESGHTVGRILHSIALTMALFGTIIKATRPLFRMASGMPSCCACCCS